MDRGSWIVDRGPRIVVHKMRWSLLTALAIGGCASNTSTVARIPGQLSAADTAAIVAAALNYFASPNGPVVAVVSQLSCNPQTTRRCAGPSYFLESAAALTAIESYASQRGMRLLTSLPNRIPCSWSDSTASEKGVGLSVSVPHIRENRVQVSVSIGCVGSRRDPGEGFAEGLTYHMELVEAKWKVKAIIGHVIT